MKVKNGNKVKIEYTGTLDDGTIFDSTKHKDHSHPLEFEVGSKQVIPGFEKAVMGMKKGEEKTFRLEPEKAYGHHNPKLIKNVPRDKLPPQVKAGMILGLQLPNGGQMPVKVLEVTEKEVKMDLNHPLAGKALNFKIKVIEIKKTGKEGIQKIPIKKTAKEKKDDEKNAKVTEKRL